MSPNGFPDGSPNEKKNALFLGKVRFFSVGGSVGVSVWTGAKRIPQRIPQRIARQIPQPEKKNALFPGKVRFFSVGVCQTDPPNGFPHGFPDRSPNGKKKTHFS